MERTYTEQQIERTVTKDRKAYDEGLFFIARRVVAETDKGIGLEQDRTDDLLWLPKSQIDVVEMIDGHALIHIRPWLADAKDFTKVSYL